MSTEPTGTPAAERGSSLLRGIITYLMLSAFFSGMLVGWSAKHCRPSVVSQWTLAEDVIVVVGFPLLLVQAIGYGMMRPPDDGHCNY